MLTVFMAAMLAGDLSHHNMTHVVPEVSDSIVLRQAVLDASSFTMLTVFMAGDLSHHNMTHVVPEVKTDISGFRSSQTNISEDRQQCTMTPMQKSVVADALGTIVVAGTAWIQLVDGAALALVEPVDSAAVPHGGQRRGSLEEDDGHSLQLKFE